MYCSTSNSRVDVYEDGGRLARRIIVNGTVESAYMSGDDKVVITYSRGDFRYTELWETSGRLIRRNSCR